MTARGRIKVFPGSPYHATPPKCTCNSLETGTPRMEPRNITHSFSTKHQGRARQQVYMAQVSRLHRVVRPSPSSSFLFPRFHFSAIATIDRRGSRGQVHECLCPGVDTGLLWPHNRQRLRGAPSPLTPTSRSRAPSSHAWESCLRRPRYHWRCGFMFEDGFFEPSLPRTGVFWRLG